MALNIKDPETERLAAEVAAVAHETKTRAVRIALKERKQRLAAGGAHQERARSLNRFLAEEVWPQVPRALLGTAIPRAEREAILGYSSDGV